MRPPVAAPMVCAKRTALAWLPGVSLGQSVTSFNCRVPCASAGATPTVQVGASKALSLVPANTESITIEGLEGAMKELVR